jgi:hypothetical protein
MEIGEPDLVFLDS